jgi:hypothetical protein
VGGPEDVRDVYNLIAQQCHALGIARLNVAESSDSLNRRFFASIYKTTYVSFEEDAASMLIFSWYATLQSMSPELPYGDYLHRWVEYSNSVGSGTGYFSPLAGDLVLLESKFMAMFHDQSAKPQDLIDMEEKLLQWREQLRKAERSPDRIPQLGYFVIRYEW